VARTNIQITATDKTQKAFDSVKKNAAKAAKSVVGIAAAAAVAAGGYSVAKTIEYGAALSDLSAITGAVGDNLQYLDRAAKQYGSTTTLSASQSLTAMKLIASAKPDLLDNAAALATVTGEVIKLSEASGVDLANAADTVGESLNQFGADADQAGRFVNVLAAGAKFGSSAVADTAVALRDVGTVAHDAGLSFEMTNAAIQAMAKVGIKAGKAGTGLRNILLSLSTQTRDEFNPEIVGFTKAISNLSQAHLTSTEKAKLFGRESIGAGNALMKEAGNLETLTAKLTGTNVAYDQAHTRNNNLMGDLKSLNSVVEAQAIAFGQKLDPSLRVLVKGFTDVISLEKTTADEANNARAASLNLAVGVAQVADIAGNAANGIALPFEILGDAIGAVAAQISFVVEGEFSKAMAAGAAGAESMKQRLLDVTDPTITNRFEALAKQMAALEQPKPKADAPSTASPASASGDQDAVKKAAAEASAVADVKNNIDAEQKAAELARHQEQYAALASMAIAANDDEETRRMDAFQAKVDAMDAEKAYLIEHHAWGIEQQAAYDDAQRELAIQLENDIYAIRAKGMSANEKLAQASAKTQLKTSADLLTTLTASAATESRGMFEINKAASLATATIDGIAAVQSSYKAGAAVGGPVLGAAFAGVAAVATAANLKKIQSTSYGGGGGSTGSAGGGIPSLATSTGTPVTPTVEENRRAADEAAAREAALIQQQQQPLRPVNIYLQGNLMTDTFVQDVVIPTIQDQVTNSDVQLIAPDSANAHTLGVGVAA
jgi:TP901 family phage tail tape measure protein